MTEDAAKDDSMEDATVNAVPVGEMRNGAVTTDETIAAAITRVRMTEDTTAVPATAEDEDDKFRFFKRVCFLKRR